ncbi:MAG: CHASE2 domain-containing protein [Verrucomicrobia bacterium]|nr:CHASE2 domain-containing protein [Verrucomicrobiota bacterium]
MTACTCFVWVWLIGLWLATAKAAAPEPFRVVFVDDACAARFGGFPLPRNVLAAGIEAIAAQKPRGIVLKMFIDQPKESRADEALAVALTKTPVVLEARIDDTEPRPNPMPERFYAPGLPLGAEVAVSGESGWLPLALLSSKAHDIGFVDVVSPMSVPLVERYRGRFVKSLDL